MIGHTILGGRLSPPFDLSIQGELPVSMDAVTRNIAAASALGLSGIEPRSKMGRRLAVVAGGPSIARHVDTLRNWSADRDAPDIWAINGALGWCRENDVPAVFLAIDPHPIVARWALGARSALLGSCCDPVAFEALISADVQVFHLGNGGTKGGSSTATIAPHLAATLGYASVTLFGCESSYEMGATHAYQHEPRPDEMLIACDGKEYLTAPDYFMQARDLSLMLRELPEYLSEESGGLLRAMVNDQSPQVRWVSQAMADGLSPIRDGKLPHCKIGRVFPRKPKAMAAE